MSIKFWIAGPVTVLGLIAVVVAGWLTWGPMSNSWRSEADTRRGLAMVEHAAQLREAQHLASGLAASIVTSVGGEHDALVGRMRGAISETLWHLEEIRGLAAGPNELAALRRLDDDLARWRDGLETAVATRNAGQSGAAALEAEAERLSRMAGNATDEVIAGLLQSEEEHLAQHRRAGALSVSLLGGALLCMGWLALGFARSMTGAMQSLPSDLQAFIDGRSPGRVTGETRDDELGDMARALRGVAESIHDLSISRAEMEKMALTDPLTGLPNRRGLYEHFGRADLRDAWSEGRTVAALHLDLDHFKTINDTNGHEAGDAVLREAARRMTMAIRDSDLLARVGGDEFVIFARGIESLSALEGLCDRVIRQFDMPIPFRDTSFAVTASIGAVLGGRRDRLVDPKRLLVSADVALCHAKAAGRNRFAIFTSAMAQDARRQHDDAASIRLGIQRGEFEVHFQPVIDIRTGRTTGLTLLPRWRHPDRGLLMPKDFLAVAEAHGLTEGLGLPLLDQALRTVAKWRGDGIGVPRLHIGVSRTLLLSTSLLDRIRWSLDATGCEPERLVIHVSEKYCAGRAVELVFRNVLGLGDLGAAIAVDDFGTVDAAIGTIAQLRATRINVATGPAALLLGDNPGRGVPRDDLLRGFLRVGETMGVQVQAKQVDDRADLERLATIGYAEMQGAAVAPAMDIHAAQDWLTRRMVSGPRLVAG